MYITDKAMKFLAVLIQTVLLHIMTNAAISDTRFGFVGTKHSVPEMEGFPNAVAFYHEYTLLSQPLKMTGAAKLSPAYHLWTDEYFLTLPVPENDVLEVQAAKKDLRTHAYLSMSLREFIQQYNESDLYYNYYIPKYLAKDVVLPQPLQCSAISDDKLIESFALMSSGGTKSAIHVDTMENILCVFAGIKQFILVDPTKYGDMVVLDNPGNAYSSIDVDSVDYEKYPDLLQVEYHHVNVSAGDCIYVPYNWIHQVRSYDRNLAVTLWWNPANHKAVVIDECDAKFDSAMTLDKVNFTYTAQLRENIRDSLWNFIYRLPSTVTMQTIEEMMLKEMNMHLDTEKNYIKPLREIFRVLDYNKNGAINIMEFMSASDEDLHKVNIQTQKLEEISDNLIEYIDNWEDDFTDGQSEGQDNFANDQDPVHEEMQPEMLEPDTTEQIPSEEQLKHDEF